LPPGSDFICSCQPDITTNDEWPVLKKEEDTQLLAQVVNPIRLRLSPPDEEGYQKCAKTEYRLGIDKPADQALWGGGGGQPQPRVGRGPGGMRMPAEK
jgi:hypothetical protein